MFISTVLFKTFVNLRKWGTKMEELQVDPKLHRPAQEEMAEWAPDDLTMERLKSDGVLQ
jgi:hypothetical protein